MPETSTPKDSTIRKLFALSMNQCAFPNCINTIVDSTTNTILGEVCHICAQSSGGLRYNNQQTTEERRSFKNLVLLCSEHHKVIDASDNLHIYTVDYLLSIKSDHEETARKAAVKVSALSDSLVAELQKTIGNYSRTIVHMDFRGAQLKAGGEGGYRGGAGGEGGVINIVGVTPAGFHEPIAVDGGDGKFPGGGGGGGGATNFTGRPADENDCENGLRVSTIFLADMIQYAEGFFYVLRGGWESYFVTSLPSNLQLNLFCVVETGTIPIDTMLRLDYSIKDAEGHSALENCYYDLSISKTTPQARRWYVTQLLPLTVSCTGLWHITVSSGSNTLATHDIEFLLANER